MRFFEDVEVGHSQTSTELVLSETDIIEFAKLWDPLPFHIDREVADRSPLGGLSASASHVFCVGARLLHELPPMAVIAGLRHEIEMLEPARPDVPLAMTVTCTGKRESESKSDRGTLQMSSELKTPSGAVIARFESTIMIARRPE